MNTEKAWDLAYFRSYVRGRGGAKAVKVEDLKALTEKHGVRVRRADGKKDLAPTKADYLRALGL